MTNYKFIKNNDEEDNTSKTVSPAENRKRHKPVKGLPRT